MRNLNYKKNTRSVSPEDVRDCCVGIQ